MRSLSIWPQNIARYSPVKAVIEYDKDAHLETVKHWWDQYYGDCFPDCLPDKGSVALENNKPAAVAFLFTANAKIAFIAFMVCDPDLGHVAKTRAMKAAAKDAFDKARELLGDQGMIVGITDHPMVSRIYEENGMFCADGEKAYFAPVGKKSCNFLR